jgi:hypothetical protein
VVSPLLGYTDLNYAGRLEATVNDTAPRKSWGVARTLRSHFYFTTACGNVGCLGGKGGFAGFVGCASVC